jgi:hypothetical protein
VKLIAKSRRPETRGRHGVCIWHHQQQQICGKEYPLPFLPEKIMTRLEMAATAFTGACMLVTPIVIAVMLVR